MKIPGILKTFLYVWLAMAIAYRVEPIRRIVVGEETIPSV